MPDEMQWFAHTKPGAILFSLVNWYMSLRLLAKVFRIFRMRTGSDNLKDLLVKRVE